MHKITFKRWAPHKKVFYSSLIAYPVSYKKTENAGHIFDLHLLNPVFLILHIYIVGR
jgi:hypothetical protein